MLSVATTMNGMRTFYNMTVDLEEQVGSLEMAEAFATTEMENASIDMKSAARSFMDARKLVAQVKTTRWFCPVVGVGAFHGSQSTTPRASAATKASDRTKSD